MKMEKTEDNKFIKFNSEVALRKGDNGWIINTLLENYRVFKRSSDSKYVYKFKFGYVFTKKNLKDKTTERWFFWEGNESNRSKLYLKIPKTNESPWYNSGNFVREDTVSDSEYPQIAFSSPKEYYGVWISKEGGDTDWIFKNIEFWANQKEYSEVFCKYSEICQKTDSAGHTEAYKMDSENIKTWFDSGQVTQRKNGQTSDPTYSSILSQINSMINSIKDIKGDWVDMDEVCDLRWTRNLDNLQKQQLSMYCTNGKKAK